MNARIGAALSIAAMVATFVCGLFWSGGSLARLNGTERVSDPETYERILSRLRNGEPYYEVVGDELRASGYATVEVFNWRTPLLWRSLAPLPPIIRRILLTALGCSAWVSVLLVSARVSRSAAVVTAITAAGAALLMSAPGAVGMGEAWAGGLLGLSVCAYARERFWLGFCLGLLAVFVRELVVPFALVATTVAVGRGRWREVGAWLLGGVGYVTYYGLHLMHVLAQRSPADTPGVESWVSFGGLTFLLSTVQWNALLFFAPWPFVCACLALIVGGIASSRCPVHVRWTAAVYAILFLAVGKHYDRYWGYLTWPTWSLACGCGADRLVSSCRTLWARSAGAN